MPREARATCGSLSSACLGSSATSALGFLCDLCLLRELDTAEFECHTAPMLRTIVAMSARMLRAIAVLAAAAISPPYQELTAQNADTMQCRPTGATVKVAELSESSGVAASRVSPGTVWALNDSGEPVLYALNANGTVTGRVRVMGARVEDWEAIAVGPCASGSCLYIGDIGDNNGSRKQITVYRTSEPAATGESTVHVEGFYATYPDGPQDAESLLIAPDGSLYIVTKGETRSVALYRFPRDLKPGESVQLERLGTPRDPHATKQADRITDAASSPRGDWVVLRTNRTLEFHRTKELLSGNWRPAHVVDLTSLKEPQGEGVTFAGDDSIVITGEGGGKSAPGTLARLSCPLLR
jgi:hypothetical protein